MAALFFIMLPSLVVLLVIYVFVTLKFDYWKKRKVPHLKPLLFFGNYKDYITLKKSSPEVAQDICREFPNEPYIGTYYGTEPALLVQDPELLKLIMAGKAFPYFSSREISKYSDTEIITRNMFFTYGDKWKVLRQNISPLFTISKLKNMFPLIQECAKQFEDMLQYETSTSKVLEARSLMARFMMDCVVSCAFGIEANVMGKDVGNNPFRKMGDLIFEISSVRGVALYARAMWPGLFYRLGLSVFPKAIGDFFHKLLTDVFVSRGYKPSNRNDFVDLVLNLRSNAELTSESILQSSKGQKVRLSVDDELLVSQCIMFFAAGYETSASTTSVALYYLAKNQDAQTKAMEEVDEYLRKKAGKIEFDCLSELPYLEACVNEAMRLQPVLGLLTREVTEPYVMPDGLKLEPGLRVHIPVYHMHMNPTYFPEPEAFKPERFLGENKEKIVPFTYLPFGEGQRICLGMRIAKMQMYPGLITVLKKYHLHLAKDMPTEGGCWTWYSYLERSFLTETSLRILKKSLFGNNITPYSVLLRYPKKTSFEPRSFVTQIAGPIQLTFTPRY